MDLMKAYTLAKDVTNQFRVKMFSRLFYKDNKISYKIYAAD